MTAQERTVRRWHFEIDEYGAGGVYPHPTGEFVKFTDYDSLEGERDVLREELAAVRAALTDLHMAVWDTMRENDFPVSETLSVALDIASDAIDGAHGAIDRAATQAGEGESRDNDAN